MRKGFWLIGFIMTVLILMSALFLMWSNVFIEKIPAPNRDYMALVFFAYSGFRTYRLYKQYPYIFSNENQD